MKKYATLAVLALALVITPNVTAQSDQVQNKKQEVTQRSEEKKAEREARLEARNAKKCELIKVRIEAQFEKSEDLFEIRTAKYQRILDRLNALVLRLENNDIDSTELKEVVTEASELVSDMETTYGQYTADLRNAANLSCVDDVDFKDTLQTARSGLRTARQDDQDIRDYLREEARTVIEAIIETNNGQPVEDGSSEDTDSVDSENSNDEDDVTSSDSEDNNEVE